MENKTAVEWLIENIPSLFIDDSGHYEKLFCKLLELEKQQIIAAFNKGMFEEFMKEKKWHDRNGHSYYLETFKNKNK